MLQPDKHLSQRDNETLSMATNITSPTKSSANTENRIFGQNNIQRNSQNKLCYDLINQQISKDYRPNSPGNTSKNDKASVEFKPEIFSLHSNDSINNIYNKKSNEETMSGKNYLSKKYKSKEDDNSTNKSHNERDSMNAANLYMKKEMDNNSITTPKQGKHSSSNHYLEDRKSSNNSNNYKHGKLLENKKATSPASSERQGFFPSNKGDEQQMRKTIYDKLNNDNYGKLGTINVYYMRKMYTFWMRNDISHYFAETFRAHIQANWKHIRYGLHSKVINMKDLKCARFLNDNLDMPSSPKRDNFQNFNPKKKILVLDLDETLVHCKAADSLAESTRSWDRKIQITMSGGTIPLSKNYR